MKSKLILLVLLAAVKFGYAQHGAHGPINWTNISDAEKRSKTEKKKVFIDVYTEWCGWCKKMDMSTFMDPEVARIMNKYFYAVKFDAEQKDSLVFNNHTFKNQNPTGRGTHEFAISLLSGKMGYPTFVVLDENFSIYAQIPGYITKEDMVPILKYFGEDHVKKMTFDEYKKTLAPATKSETKPETKPEEKKK